MMAVAIIPVAKIANAPKGPTLSASLKDEAEAITWGERHNVKTVYLYKHLTGGYTGWIEVKP